MIRLTLFLFVAGTWSCSDPRYEQVNHSWVDEQVVHHDLEHLFVGQMQDDDRRLHGREVKVRGKLVYEYDEASIYPFADCNDFKPVRIQVDQDDRDLHYFLLKNDEALVTVTGTIDTLERFDERQYAIALKDIARVEVSHILAKR